MNYPIFLSLRDRNQNPGPRWRIQKSWRESLENKIICFLLLWLHWPNTQKYTKCLIIKKNVQISPKEPFIPDVFRFLGSHLWNFTLNSMHSEMHIKAYPELLYLVQDQIVWFSYCIMTMARFAQNLLQSSGKTLNLPSTRLRFVILGTIRNMS